MTVTATASAAGSNSQTTGTAVVGQSYVVSMWIRRRTGTGDIFIRPVENTGQLTSITTSWARYSATRTATTTTLRVGIQLDTLGDEVDIAFPQAEPTGVDSPKAYVSTGSSASAYHGPRFLTDPVTFAPLGLLIEPARTNTCLWSNDLSQAARWFRTEATLGASVDGPGGNATLVVPSEVSGQHTTQQSVTNSAAQTTVSFYAKDGGYSKCAFREATSTGVITVFNLSAITVDSGTGTIKDVGNGWRFCTATWTATAGARTHAFFVLPAAFSGGGPNSYNWSGDGTSGVYFGGFQVEVGASGTSLIQTQSVSVARQADMASLSGVNFSSWFRDSGEATLYAEGSSGDVVSTAAMTLDDGTTTNNNYSLLWSRSSTTTGGAQSFSGGVMQNDWIPTSGFSSAMKKVAVRFRANDSRPVQNGTFLGVVADTASTPPVNGAITKLWIGNRSIGGVAMAGTIKTLRVASVGASDAELISMTS